MSAQNKLKSSTVLDQAVHYHLPFWEKFTLLEIYQWAWEFLRRNPEYIKDSLAFRKKWKAWEKANGHIDVFDREEPSDLIRMGLLITTKYGICRHFSPDREIEHPYYWSEHLIGKLWSEIKGRCVVENDDDEGNKTVTVKLSEGYDIIVINYNSPDQLYKDEIDRRYAQQQKKFSKAPRVYPEKFPLYLKTYDLRMWGIERKLYTTDSAGKTVSEPTWEEIAEYLYPGQNKSVQTVRGHFKSAEDLIYGGYKNLLLYKSG